jgi:tripartite ATP-independent transporter DctP family solute receptor
MPISRRRFLTNSAMTGAAAPFILRARPALAAITLRIGNSFPISHPLNVRLKGAIEEVEAKTGGALRIRNFPDSQLGSDGDMMSQARSGAIDGVCTSVLFLESFEPAANLAGLGYGYRDYDEVWRVWDGEVGAFIRGKLDKIGLYGLEKIYDNGFRQVTNSVRPISTPDNLSGLKIRVPSTRIQQSLFEHLGAAPTPLSIKETYSALKTHIVDGQENALTHIEVWKFYEVQKYVSLTNHMWDGLSVLINKDRINSLPAPLRQAFEDTFNRYALLQRKDMVDLLAALKTKLVTERHMELNDVDVTPFRTKLMDAGFYREWRQIIGDDAWSLYEKAIGSA